MSVPMTLAESIYYYGALVVALIVIFNLNDDFWR